MDVREMRNEALGKRVVKALESRNMEAYYVKTKEEAVKKALELIPAYAFGPKNVLLIVGMNKVVKTQEDAMSRARNEAGPINAQRFGINTPCVKNGSCFNCKSDDCICAEILVTRFSRIKNRFKIILVDEPLGF